MPRCPNRQCCDFRWVDPEPDNQSTPIEWRSAALIIATLFLNFPFWYVIGPDLPMFCPIPFYAALLGAEALVITALFFVGPALATQAAKRPLFSLIENSLGSIPAFGVRFCGALVLTLWIVSFGVVSGAWWSSYILRRAITAAQSGIIVAVILLFLFITGLQSLRTNARLALFTNKLGIAILVAALLRVHQGWATVLKGFPPSPGRSAISDLWHALSLLAFYVAPLALLAADFGYRMNGRKPVAMTALTGVALPLAGTLLFVGAIDVATFASQFYIPSLNPSVAMALWGHAAARALPGLMMVTAITMFGAVRFGARMLAESLSIFALGSRLGQVVLLGCLVGAIAWFSVHPYAVNLSALFEMSATCIVVVAAVLTADFVTGSWRVDRVRKIDLVGLAAVLAGSMTPLYMPYLLGGADPWWHPWLLPSYGVGFLVCLFGRAAQKMRMTGSR